MNKPDSEFVARYLGYSARFTSYQGAYLDGSTVSRADSGAQKMAAHRGPRSDQHVEYPEENALNIYPDGSMRHGPRRAGGGILFVLVDEEGKEWCEEEVLPAYQDSTQNELELEAVIRALQRATGRRPPFNRERYRKIVVKTDSTYVSENLGSALYVWSKNGWLTRHGKPVDNANQWKELVRLVVLSSKQGKPVTVKWVKGKRSPTTKAADSLAKRSSLQRAGRQLKPAEIRRKRTDQPLEEIGTIPMEGQEMVIHIFKTQQQRLHGLTKCGYSVVSEGLPHSGRASWIYTELPVRRHTYRVRVNEDTHNPRILAILEDLGTS